ncbi:MAG: heterodisulfide reductase subunit C [Limisphaerales bacterium]|jgi:heterodisulfide reductase subunit C
MSLIQPILFALITLATFAFAFSRYKRIFDNIGLGKPEEIEGSFNNMMLFALGQRKMFRNLLVAFLHGAIYVAFLFTQVELIEIFIDGFTGKHRIVYHAIEDSALLKGLYVGLVSSIEILSLFALIATFIFLARRNLLKVPRFVKPEMKGWPKLDGNIILYLEIVLVIGVFTMNGADEALYRSGAYGYEGSYHFALSSTVIWHFFAGMSEQTIHVIERIGWWLHILVVYSFLLYIPGSKHLHVFLAFPNTYFTRTEQWGKMRNMPEIQNEIKMMMDPSAAPAGEMPPPPDRFGAKDVTDLSWKQLMDAYSCTECGRCTDACPANQTGKKLSPRKIMMDTRDRLEIVGENKRQHGADHDDDKALLGDFISPEELRACTTCNACVQECPVNINPLSIILELRRHLILDQSDSPEAWTSMFTNVENNGAPWAFPAADRANWTEDI